MRASDIPNLITVGRILLVAPVAWALMVQDFMLALILFFVAGVSDAVDGFLAKRFGWESRLGALLDPLADKFLLVTCYGVLAWNGLLPMWLLVLVLIRDLLIVGGAVVYNFRIRHLEAAPTLISKLNTLLQILLVLLVIIQQAIGWGQERWIDWLIYAVTISVIWSGLDYIVTWTRRARSYQ
ncbi:MAG: CDP-alcohol phosphatidyltransferase family protein [Gammaproteobacteria bacterium]|nr:MAG: CDP-alcohol phosphatidyltransferase family protein [Gammaproteobacteria bacterium]